MRPKFGFMGDTRPRAQWVDLVSFKWVKCTRQPYLNKKGQRGHYKMALVSVYNTVLPP